MEIPTNMHLLIFLAACVLITTTECATSFQNCSDGSVDVVQNTTGVLTCVGYSAAEITWVFKSPQSSFQTVGRCTSSSTCNLESTYDGIFTLTPTSGTSSYLTLTTTFTAGLKNATFACDGVECRVSIVEPPPTTPEETTTEPTPPVETTGAEVPSSSTPVVSTWTGEPSSSTPEKGGPSDGEIVGIVIGCIVPVAIIIVVIVILWFKKKKKFCFKTNGNGTGNTPSSNDNVLDKPANANAPDKPANANAPDKPANANTTGSAVPADGRTRELPQPKRRQGATATPNETPGVVDNASSSPRPRELPQPRITEHNMTTSVPPPSLPPLRTQATTSLTSVERNSFAETKKPLPSISPRETQ